MCGTVILGPGAYELVTPRRSIKEAKISSDGSLLVVTAIYLRSSEALDLIRLAPFPGNAQRALQES